MQPARRLTAEQLAEAWYWTEPPPDWLIGFGDIFHRVGYPYRDPAGFAQIEPVLAVCIEHPCEAAAGMPRRISFVRAYVLEEYLADNPRAWSKLSDIAAGRHLDLCLFPSRPGFWETELIVDLADDFSAEPGVDFQIESRMCGLRDGYWHTFAHYVARRSLRAGVTRPVPGFRTNVIAPQQDGIARPKAIPDATFDLSLRPHESDIHPAQPMAVRITHLLRPDADQHWWKAEWPEFTWVAGYARTTEAAIEVLVRAVRRLALEPEQMPDDIQRQFRSACNRVGIAVAG